MANKVLFIDRDGTLVEEPADFQVDALDKVRLVTGVIPALLQLAASGYRFIMVSNQDGLGSAAFPQAQFDTCHDFLMQLLSSQGIDFEQVLICPHLPGDGCDCRKPRTGLLTAFLAATDIDLDKSAVIGDRATDMELAERIGIRGLLVNNEESAALTWSEIVTQLCFAERVGTVRRSTTETDISVAVNLDNSGNVAIGTGIAFFDHMLEQIAKHGGFDLQVRCTGDLQVDEHHSVEDTAICLGSAIRQALDDKLGVGRYGFLLPMDESEAKVALDLSGRAAFRFTADFPRDNVGQLSTEMVEHFFRSFGDALGAALHIEVHGENTHHMVEACFKAVGRSLRQAITRKGTDMPSTKGTLKA